MRVSTLPEDMVVLQTYQDQLAEAVAKYPSTSGFAWPLRLAFLCRLCALPRRPCSTRCSWPTGVWSRWTTPTLVRSARSAGDRHAPPSGVHSGPTGGSRRHTDEVIAEADAAARLIGGAQEPTSGAAKPSSPLEGILVLRPGPGCGRNPSHPGPGPARSSVIKVQYPARQVLVQHQSPCVATGIRTRSRSTSKDPEPCRSCTGWSNGLTSCNTNMRYDAAERLGIDYESLRQLNPKLIYCHTLGHEQGPREPAPRQRPDRSGSGGGGMAGRRTRQRRPGRSGRSPTLGDTGNGFLSALRHHPGHLRPRPERRRPVLADFDPVRPSSQHVPRRGSPLTQRRWRPAAARRRKYGWHALYRCTTLPKVGSASPSWTRQAGRTGPGARTNRPGNRPAVRQRRRPSSHNDELVAELTAVFAQRTAAEWFHHARRLEGALRDLRP